jgi:hypothetical protein
MRRWYFLSAIASLMVAGGIWAGSILAKPSAFNCCNDPSCPPGCSAECPPDCCPDCPPCPFCP